MSVKNEYKKKLTTPDVAVLLGKSLANIPSKVGALVHAIGHPNGERDPETPISVVGASIIGGVIWLLLGLWVLSWVIS